jgi:hypothetical protein
MEKETGNYLAAWLKISMQKRLILQKNMLHMR